MEHAAARDITLPVAGEHLDTGEDSPEVAARTGLSVSVETLAWGFVTAVGAAMRLAALGRAPFTVAEASRALDAARVSRGDVPDGWPGDLASAVTSYLFRMFGESEVVARLLPALAGVALIGVLWFARGYVGRAGALLAAVFVAVSPLFVMAGRSALPLGTGSLLAVVMAVSLFGYVREPRPWLVFPLAVAMALAPLTDAIAVSGVIAVLAFVAVEVGVFGNAAMSRAWDAFRASRLQWVSALLVGLAALELGLTHFGASLDKTGLPGLRAWADMFAEPRDSRAPEYHFALLLGYDWPLFLAGTAGFMLYAARFARGGAGAAGPFHRFLLMWTAVAALVLAFTTRREAGQLLALLLPLALLAGSLLEEVIAGLDWSVARRWWFLGAGALVLAAYSALLMTQWSSGNAGPVDRFVMVLAAGGALFLLAAPLVHLQKNGAVIPLTVVGVLAVAFLGHSSLAVAFGDRAEYAVDARLTERADTFRDTVDQLAAERGSVIVVESSLQGTLGWTLRDSNVAFGGPAKGASAVIASPNNPPAGFAAIGDVWTLAEGWYPEQLLRPRSMWRWLLYRDSYGGLETTEVRIYVPTI